MAALQEDIAHPDQLEELAVRLERKADALMDQRTEILREARDYRHRAEMIRTRATRHVRVMPRIPRRQGSSIQARDLARVGDAVKQLEPCSTDTIAEHLGITGTMALARLKRLEEIKAVYRTGVKSTVRWQTEPIEGLNAPPTPLRSYCEQVRDIGMELGTGGNVFTRQEVVDAGVSYPTATKWLSYWVEREAFECEEIDGQHVYGVKAHASAPVNRQQRPTPEQVARTIHGTRGVAVAGTGKASGTRGIDAEVRKLIEDARAAGAEVEKTEGNHWQVRQNGTVIGGFAGTPSDVRSIPNSRSALKRKGLEI